MEITAKLHKKLHKKKINLIKKNPSITQIEMAKALELEHYVDLLYNSFDTGNILYHLSFFH